MDSKIRKMLLRIFSKQMAIMCKNFREIPPESGVGGLLFEWTIGREMSCYIYMQPFRKTDEFAIEAAWSVSHRFPWQRFPMNPIDVPELGRVKDVAIDGEMRFRCGVLWPPYRGGWWRVSRRPGLGDSSWEMEDAEMSSESVDFLELEMERVVDDVLTHVIEFVIPYFESVRDEQARDGQRK